MEKVTRPQSVHHQRFDPVSETNLANAEEMILRNALLLIDNGDYKGANSLLRDLLSKNNYNLDAIEWLGYCFRKQGDLENARRCYAQLVKHCPDEYSYAGLAEIYYDMGYEAEAERFYHLALGEITYESPLLFQIYKNLGNIAIRLGDFENAEEKYSKAYAINQHSDVLFVNYGTLALQKGDLNLAGQRFSEAIELNNQSDNAWVGLAMVHWEKGDRVLAIGSLERALDLMPTNETAIRLYADWCVREGRLSHAVAKTEDFLRLKPLPSVALILVELLFRLGNFQAARNEINKAQLLGVEPELASRWDQAITEGEASRHA